MSCVTTRNETSKTISRKWVCVQYNAIYPFFVKCSHFEKRGKRVTSALPRLNKKANFALKPRGLHAVAAWPVYNLLNEKAMWSLFDVRAPSVRKHLDESGLGRIKFFLSCF
jgi:hypothetical protein